MADQNDTQDPFVASTVSDDEDIDGEASDGGARYTDLQGTRGCPATPKSSSSTTATLTPPAAHDFKADRPVRRTRADAPVYTEVDDQLCKPKKKTASKRKHADTTPVKSPTKSHRLAAASTPVKSPTKSTRLASPENDESERNRGRAITGDKLLRQFENFDEYESLLINFGKNAPKSKYNVLTSRHSCSWGWIVAVGQLNRYTQSAFVAIVLWPEGRESLFALRANWIFQDMQSSDQVIL